MMSLRPPLALLFAVFTLAPLGLVLAAGLGALPALAGLLCMAVLVSLLDVLVPATPARAGAEFPGSDALLVIIALGHLVLLPLLAQTAATQDGMRPGEKVALVVAAGLWIGQVAVPAAHELIHRTGRLQFWLGAAVFAAMLFGHHASAHRLVHHARAGSPGDPNTARAGEGFYHFLPRAWVGSFREGFNAERRLRKGKGVHPYAIYAAGSVFALLLATAVGGTVGVIVWVAVSLHGQLQLLLADYVQHYGLSRPSRSGAGPAPVSAADSWNAPHWASGLLSLHASRHSDHHSHPARSYPVLRLPEASEAPFLPCSLPMACTLALFPPLWRRVMDPRLCRWRAGT